MPGPRLFSQEGSSNPESIVNRLEVLLTAAANKVITADRLARGLDKVINATLTITFKRSQFNNVRVSCQGDDTDAEEMITAFSRVFLSNTDNVMEKCIVSRPDWHINVSPRNLFLNADHHLVKEGGDDYREYCDLCIQFYNMTCPESRSGLSVTS